MRIKDLMTTFFNKGPRNIIGSLAEKNVKLSVDIAEVCQIKKDS